MKSSKYILLDNNTLAQYIYDSNNLFISNYSTIKNELTKELSFVQSNDSGSLNKELNNLIRLDTINPNLFGQVSTTQYPFIKIDNYTNGTPLRYDSLRLNYPINWTFDVFFGIKIGVYILSSDGRTKIYLSNYFIDRTDINRFNTELFVSNNEFLYGGRLWGKYIDIPIISIPYLQDINHPLLPLLAPNNISQNSPIFIEYSYIENKDEFSSVITYTTTDKIETGISSSPEHDSIGIEIKPSTDGDWFDISPLFNGQITEFSRFIQNAISNGLRYNVRYEISLFERNIKGNTFTVLQSRNFNESIEYRPIIKTSSTTAVIEVKMAIIDTVSNMTIDKTASYGLTGEEIGKYSKSMVRINIDGLNNVTVYNKKITNNILGTSNNNTNVEVVRIPTPLLVDVSSIVAKSDSTIINNVANNDFWTFGRLKIIVTPFDNIFKFVIAKAITSNNVEYFDLTNLSNLQLVFKNFNEEVSCDLIANIPEVDLANGSVVFRLNRNKVSIVRRIFNSNINTFYITFKSQGSDIVNVLYQGTFIMSDSIQYVNGLASEFNNNVPNASIRRSNSGEFAIITRQRAPLNPNQILDDNDNDSTSPI